LARRTIKSLSSVVINLNSLLGKIAILGYIYTTNIQIVKGSPILLMLRGRLIVVFASKVVITLYPCHAVYLPQKTFTHHSSPEIMNSRLRKLVHSRYACTSFNHAKTSQLVEINATAQRNGTACSLNDPLQVNLLLWRN